MSNLIGRQFDVKSNRFKNHKLKSKRQEILLQDIATINKGKSITKEKIKEGEYPVIAGGQTSPYSHSEYNETENAITISASGAYSGYVWFHNYKIFASDCSVIRPKDEKKFLPEYLFAILKLKQNEIYKLQKGSGQPHVYPNDIAKITIPNIEIDEQISITKKIKSIRMEAERIQQKAADELEAAKKEIEKIIIG